MMKKNILPYLPLGVMLNILSRLPVKSLSRFRCVCKPWNILFNDASFIKMHLDHSIGNHQHLLIKSYDLVSTPYIEPFNEVEIVNIDYPLKNYSTPNRQFEILGSCNGLILISPFEHTYCIWNPSTKQFRKLPPASSEIQRKDGVIDVVSSDSSISLSVYGLGYDNLGDDYKVVIIALLASTDGESDVDVRVYSLGSDSWQRVNEKPFDDDGHQDLHGNGIYVKGALYWVAGRLMTPKNSDEEEDDIDEIEGGLYDDIAFTLISFSFELKKFSIVPQPNYYGIGTINVFEVNVLDGRLCVIATFSNIRVEIWMMTGDVEVSWENVCCIVLPEALDYGSLEPIKFTKNGEIVLQKSNRCFMIYDPKHETTKILNMHELGAYFETYVYLESLISLGSGTFVWQERAAWEREKIDEE